MSDFDWKETDGRTRFGYPAETVGLVEFLALVLPPTSPHERARRADYREVLIEDPLKGLTGMDKPDLLHLLPRPRVFISHRKDDEPLARLVAGWAKRNGFDFWLDVLDPQLQRLNASPGTPYQTALATAAIIELALLNCTHVLALLTAHTPGTMWVPYEYGRVKQRILASSQSGALVDSTFVGPPPEYLLLGPIHDHQTDVESWFVAESRAWMRARKLQP